MHSHANVAVHHELVETKKVGPRVGTLRDCHIGHLYLSGRRRGLYVITKTTKTCVSM